MGLITTLTSWMTPRRTAGRVEAAGPAAAGGAMAVDVANAQTMVEQKADSEGQVMPDVDDDAFEDSIELSDAGAQPRPLAKIRTKQELYEELQKNYHEVVELVRKVDNHLDREQQRSERVMEVVERIDQLIPTIENMPERLTENARELNAQLVQAIETAAGAGTDEVRASVDRVGIIMEESTKGTAEMAHTMAQFRETIGELAGSSARTDQMLQRVTETGAERELELAKMVRSGRRSMLVVSSVAIGISVLAIAGVVTLVVMQG